MRSQFNKGGTGYHLLLSPVVHPAVTIDVPGNRGTLLETPRGVIAADVNIVWWYEISEWADDPFTSNTVEPWLTPTATQYGCSGLLETGDPVVGTGFAMGSNIFEQGPTPNGTQVADGYYHPEDEVFLPTFMRSSPSNAEAVQGGTIGRYTFMGSLNPFAGFQVPATGC